jgi:hypothetical protein
MSNHLDFRYRVEWQLASADPVTGTWQSQTVSTASRQGQSRITGLTNGTQYRVRVVRLARSTRSGADVALRVSPDVLRSPTADYESIAGYDGAGPPASDGATKAQYVTSADGVRGVIVSLTTSNFNNLTVDIVSGGTTTTYVIPKTGTLPAGVTAVDSRTWFIALDWTSSTTTATALASGTGNILGTVTLEPIG